MLSASGVCPVPEAAQLGSQSFESADAETKSVWTQWPLHSPEAGSSSSHTALADALALVETAWLHTDEGRAERAKSREQSKKRNKSGGYLNEIFDLV